MQVSLLHYTPLNICSHAIRTCWNSFNKGDSGGDVDKGLIDRVGNKLKHKSTLEHLYYTFYIQGISRALLQELSRHRIASLSVKSSRYTLIELKKENSFLPINEENMKRIERFIVLTKNEEINSYSIHALENLRISLSKGISTDIAKYCMPEAYKTELTWTINARSLQNFLELRSSTHALEEIRNLANTLKAEIPKDHRFIFNI